VISLGLDVGKEQDPAALAALRTVGLRPNSHRPLWDLLSIGNIELGTPYQQLADLLVTVAQELVDAGYPVVATIDATGIGAAVVEMARKAGPDLHIVAVSISSGRTLTHSNPDEYVVGKHRLTEVLQVALEQRGVTIPPELPNARAFGDQLGRFRARPTSTGYQKHEASTGHDDLVLAAELALWTGDIMHDQHAGVAL